MAVSEVSRRSTEGIKTSGVVSAWYGAYGYIEHAVGQPDAFVQFGDVFSLDEKGRQNLREGQKVSFILFKSGGRLCARSVNVIP